MTETAQTVLTFWREAGRDKWFERDETFDASIRARFAQFPRNLHRGSPLAFATDAKARAIACEALARGFDRQVEDDLRLFLYMPLGHSEDLADQDRCIPLIEALGWREATGSAREHRDIIARFGRFPHRNAALGRAATEEEQRFLDEGGFSG